MMKHSLVAAWMLFLAVSQTTTAFQVSFPPTASRTASSLTLEAKNKKRSVLGEVAASGGLPKTTTSKSRRSAPSKKSGGTVSPALAEWASTSAADDTTSSATQDKEVVPKDEEIDAELFVHFKKETKKSSRRVKQSARKQQEEQREVALQSILTNLDNVLEDQKTNTLDDILAAIRPILGLESGNLRLLTAGKPVNYRLAWVGSDDALCHFGTGLHKVPLARMQEVFLSLQERGRVEILEVIRILGPFPMVRNTLQGDSKVNRRKNDNDDSVTEWEIVMDSMIDGSGKEILAGTDDNIRRVKLDVYFADPKAILAVVPPEDGSVRADALENSGENALLFVREDELDIKLDKMRVS